MLCALDIPENENKDDWIEVNDPLTGGKRDGLTHLFYARKFRDKAMEDVTVLDFSRSGYTQVLIANKAK